MNRLSSIFAHAASRKSSFEATGVARRKRLAHFAGFHPVWNARVTSPPAAPPRYPSSACGKSAAWPSRNPLRELPKCWERTFAGCGRRPGHKTGDRRDVSDTTETASLVPSGCQTREPGPPRQLVAPAVLPPVFLGALHHRHSMGALYNSWKEPEAETAGATNPARCRPYFTTGSTTALAVFDVR
jgi:hypothetical protein